jgi:N-acetylmuramoyl-L-alanine amidase
VAATATSANLYRVRVGTFENRANAQSLAAELNGRGYATHMEPEQVDGKTRYHVQVGAYRDEKRAREIQSELKVNGYDSTLSASSPR